LPPLCNLRGQLSFGGPHLLATPQPLPQFFSFGPLPSHPTPSAPGNEPPTGSPHAGPPGRRPVSVDLQPADRASSCFPLAPFAWVGSLDRGSGQSVNAHHFGQNPGLEAHPARPCTARFPECVTSAWAEPLVVLLDGARPLFPGPVALAKQIPHPSTDPYPSSVPSVFLCPSLARNATSTRSLPPPIPRSPGVPWSYRHETRADRTQPGFWAWSPGPRVFDCKLLLSCLIPTFIFPAQALRSPFPGPFFFISPVEDVVSLLVSLGFISSVLFPIFPGIPSLSPAPPGKEPASWTPTTL